MNVKSSSPKRRRPAREPTENSKIRTNSKSFFLLNKRVCQSFFLKTLAISNGPLIKAFQHKNVYTNFFDGSDKRGKHTPSNKLGDNIVESVVNHIEQYTTRAAKSRKQVISDPEIRSLRQLYQLYKENHEHNLSYTSYKRIFNDHNFSLPVDRIRSRPKVELKPESKFEDDETEDPDEYEISEEIVQEVDESHSETIVTQVPDSSKFFVNPTQVYEIRTLNDQIQFIEIPVMSSIIEQS